MKRRSLGIFLMTCVVGCGEKSRPGTADIDGPEGTSGRSGSASAAAGSAGSAGSAESASAGVAGVAGDPGSAGGAAGASGGAGAGGAAGSADAAGAAGMAGEGSVDAAPVVSVVSPEALLEPSEGAVLTETVEVVCQASESTAPDAAAVDSTSLLVELLDLEGNVLEEAKPDPASTADEYAATLIVSDVPAGVVEIRCSATDDSREALLGADSIFHMVDHGPTITPLVPLANDALPGDDLKLEVRVEPDELVSGDDGALVDSVAAIVDGVEFPMEPGDEPDVYQVLVPFNDVSIYDPKPAGTVPIQIRASNLREPEAVTARRAYSFVLDSEGPNITVTSPDERAVVGGEVALTFNVEDAESDVDPDSVVVTINTDANRYDPDGPWTIAGNQWIFRFDSEAVQGSAIQFTVNIAATDVVGNEAETASYVFYIDNQPPYISLDPPTVRELVLKNSGKYDCYKPLDPVGNAIEDEARLEATVGRFRAVAFDRTNTAANQDTFYYSLVDQARVQLFLQTAPEAALVIDSNGDGVCDDIDPAGVVAQQELDGVTVRGASEGGSNLMIEAEASGLEIDLENCTASAGTAAPNALCGGSSDLSRAVHQYMASSRYPALFGVSVASSKNDPACTGSQWEFTDYLEEEGWICLAAVAFDHAGNRGVSKPLRVCVDDPDTDFVPSCASDSSEEPPPCQDSCEHVAELSDSPGERLLTVTGTY